MFNYSGIGKGSLAGKLLRLPLRLLPRNMKVRFVQGKLRGKKWIAGASTHGCWLGSYEYNKQRLISKMMKPGSVFFDIGANVGFFTLLGSVLVGEKGKVFAFEPFPKNIDFLEEHLKMNSIHNTTIIRAAVSNQSGTASFQGGEDRTAGHISECGQITVEVVSLDDLFFKGILPLPDFMKIDVEGAEFSVLQGAQHMLTAGSPTIFIDTHGVEVQAQCLSLLESLGYVCQSINPKKNLVASDEIMASKAVER